MRAALFCFGLVLAGCRTPEVPSGGDASVTPLDPGEANALATRFLDAREARGTEACRCAGDVPFCHAETIPPLSAAQRSCLVAHIETGGTGFREVIPCLETATGGYVMCNSAFACAEVEARTACLDGYRGDGNACFGDDPALAGLLAGCLPESSD